MVWSKVYPSYTPSRHCTIFQEKGSDWAGGLLSDCEKKALLNENFVSGNFSLSLINLRKTSWFLWFVFTEEQQRGLQSSLDAKTERRWANVYKSGHPIIFYSPNTQQIVLCLDITIFIQQLRQKDKEKYLSSYYHHKYLRFDSSHIPSSQAQ